MMIVKYKNLKNHKMYTESFNRIQYFFHRLSQFTEKCVQFEKCVTIIFRRKRINFFLIVKVKREKNWISKQWLFKYDITFYTSGFDLIHMECGICKLSSWSLKAANVCGGNFSCSKEQGRGKFCEKNGVTRGIFFVLIDWDD